MQIEAIQTASDCPDWMLQSRRQGDYKAIGRGLAKALHDRCLHDDDERSDALHAELVDLAERLKSPSWCEAWGWFEDRSEFFGRLVTDDNHGVLRADFVEGVQEYHDHNDITSR